MLEKNHYPPLSEKITPQNLTRLNAYADLLFSEAMSAGFIGDCTRDDIDTRHILDALLPALAPESCAVFPLASTRPLNVFDLGAGAGLPSLPLAILFSQHTFHLIDAQEKRLRFIAEALPKLGLTNVKLYHCVVQDFTKKFIDAHTADIIIFRAFRKVLASLELALNVLKAVESGGENPKVLYWRSQKIPFTERGEKRVADLGYNIDSFVKFTSAETILPRGLYTFSRVRPALKGYPRSWKKITADKLVEVES